MLYSIVIILNTDLHQHASSTCISAARRKGLPAGLLDFRFGIWQPGGPGTISGWLSLPAYLGHGSLARRYREPRTGQVVKVKLNVRQAGKKPVD